MSAFPIVFCGILFYNYNESKGEKMKKYFLLTSILMLAACGGGSGGGGAPVGPTQHYSTPTTVRAANSAVTSMETFSSNADAIVATVSAAGINLSDVNAISSARAGAHHRSASAATLASAYSETATTLQKRAMAELKNMYLIATDDDFFESASTLQLRNAYVLAGNDVAGFDASNRAAARAAIVGSDYATRLDAMVEKNGPEYLWRPKTDTLEGVKFRFGSEDSYVKFTLDEEGKIVSAGKWDRDGLTYSLSEEGEFTRSGTSNTFAKTLYVWSYEVDSSGLESALVDGGHVPGANAEEKAANAHDMAQNIIEQFYEPVKVMDDSNALELSTIKTRLLAKITNRVNGANGYGGAYDDAFEDAIDYYDDKVAALTAGNLPMAELDAKMNISGAQGGLKYADLGSAELIVKRGNEVLEHSYTPYVGGYDSREANIGVGQTVKFKGTAIAGIDSKHTHGGQTTQDGMLVRDTNAELTMRGDGSAKLVMNNLVGIDPEHSGQKWNKMTVETMDPTEEHGAPKFTVERVNGVPTDFQMQTFDNTGKIEVAFLETQWDAGNNNHVQSTGPLTKTIGGVVYNDVGLRYGGMAEFNTYGPSIDNPTEATSRYGFSEEQHYHSNADHDEVAIYGAFGGKK